MVRQLRIVGLAISWLMLLALQVNAQAENRVSEIEWNTVDNVVAIGFTDGTVTIDNVLSNERIATLEIDGSRITALEWNPAQQLAIGTFEGSLAYWEYGMAQAKLLAHREDRASDILWLPDDETIIVGASGAGTGITLEVWNINTGQQIYAGAPKSVLAIEWDPTQQYILASNISSGVTLIDGTTYEFIDEFFIEDPSKRLTESYPTTEVG